MQAIIYAAKSTEDKKGSIPTQLADARAFCGDEGLTVAAEYQDEAKSGYHGSRGEGLAEAKEHAERIAPCALVVQHTDRLARGDAIEAQHLVEIMLWAMKSGVTIRSVQDDSTGENLILAVVKGDQAHGESKRKSAAVKAGLARSAERGNWHGGPVPDGFKLGPPSESGGRGLVEDLERASIIRRIFELALQGIPRSAVARQLNAEGYTTRPWTKGKHPHNGLPWTSESVGDKLSNPVYKGVLVLNRRYAGEEQFIQGNWSPLIDPADFDRLGAKATARSREKAGRPTSNFLLSGLARCDSCGRPMYSRKSTPRKDGTRKHNYVCVNKPGKGGTCTAPPVDADRVDAYIVKQLDQFSSVDLKAWAEQQAAVNSKARTIVEADLTARSKALAKLEGQRDAMRTRYQEKPSNTTEEALDDLRAKVEDATVAVQSAQARLDATPAELPMDDMLDFRNALHDALTKDPAPLNERLKRAYCEVRIRTEDRTYVVLPVLRPDVIEQHGGAADRLTVVEPDGVTIMQHEVGDTSASPLMLIVPPSKAIEMVDNAWL